MKPINLLIKADNPDNIFTKLEGTNNTHYFQNIGTQRWLWMNIITPAVLKKWNYKCAKCNKEGKLDLHHTDYINQNINTIIPLCRKCHKEVEND